MSQDELKETEEDKDRIMRFVMPSMGDMDLLGQDGGVIDLKPIFYGTESMGPHIQVVDGHVDSKGKFVVDNVVGRYKLKLRADGKVELKKAQ
jgi:hypothetical protein